MLNWQAYPKLKLATQHFGKVPADLSAEEATRLETMLTHQLAMEERILEYAAQAEMTVTAADLNVALDEVKKAYPDEEAWKASMATVKLDLPSLKEALRRELLVSQVMDKVVENIKPLTEEAAKAWYLDHPRQFLQPERRMARHILITIDEENPDNYEETAYARLQTLRGQLIQTPGKFAELAMRYSECPTAVNEGKIGLVKQGQLYPELDAALFQLPERGFSKILRSPMGFHLLWCEKIHAAAPMPLDEAIPKIIAAQLDHAKKKLQKQWLNWLMQQEA
ncbi:nitrogen fixation protein NifM [Tolumonas lignilytica]|uniref:nitrogen fixation protein NifM n=1 Tax=Tolumonas lignilytica TaxID=1283284 RepID=UPI0004674C4D|nr:nitrogen fixation protein NifM [Tolumonas lignilytica]